METIYRRGLMNKTIIWQRVEEAIVFVAAGAMLFL